MSPADRIVEATMEYALRPRRNCREKVIASVLEFIIQEYSYNQYWLENEPEYDVIDVKDIRNLIQELKATETLEEPSHGITQHPDEVL
jgi:hypothetical protein